MDSVKFIEQCLNQVYQRLMSSVQGVSQEQLAWRPALHANCIGEILWHLTRAQDRMGRIGTGLGPELWVSQGWYKRFGYPREEQPGAAYQLFKGSDLAPPGLENMLAYLTGIHQDTLEKLHTLSPGDLDRVPNQQNPERTVGALFRHMIIHSNNHHGQIDYIRGLIQPGWDLPPGTGMTQR